MIAKNADQDIRIQKLFGRILICLIAGAVLTFACASILEYLPRLVVRILNLPAVIYCAFLFASETPPEVGRGLYESDKSTYCYFSAFLFNIPYYALVIYTAWWAIAQKSIRKRKNLDASK